MIRLAARSLGLLLLVSALVWALLIITGVTPNTGGVVTLTIVAAFILFAAAAAIPTKGSSK